MGERCLKNVAVAKDDIGGHRGHGGVRKDIGGVLGSMIGVRKDVGGVSGNMAVCRKVSEKYCGMSVGFLKKYLIKGV